MTETHTDFVPQVGIVIPVGTVFTVRDWLASLWLPNPALSWGFGKPSEEEEAPVAQHDPDACRVDADSGRGRVLELSRQPIRVRGLHVLSGAGSVQNG